MKRHGDDAPPFDVVKINLQRVVSIPGFIGCVHDAMVGHPEKRLRRAAQRQLEALEKEIGFDIRVVKGHVKRAGVRPEHDAETLHAQLLALRALSSHLVVVFDEFQRLRHCPGDPLAIIRSALISSVNHVSLLFTGSIRNALKMMLTDSDQPLFGEAVDLQLPQISPTDFLEYLDFQFEATTKPIADQALDYLLNATRSHPRYQPSSWRGSAGRARRPAARSAGGGDPGARPAGGVDRAVRVRDRPRRARERRRRRGERGARAAAARRPRRRQRVEPPARAAVWVLEPLAGAPRARAAPRPRARRPPRGRLVHRRSAVQRVAAASPLADRPALERPDHD